MQIEQAKLLSTAESLGLLATLERLLVTDPGVVTALSIPFFVAAAGKTTLQVYATVTGLAKNTAFYQVDDL